MSTFGKVEILTGRALVRALAEAFCDLDDELQAEFFVEATYDHHHQDQHDHDDHHHHEHHDDAAAIALQWPAGGASLQFWRIERHLATCPCATDAARELVHDLAAAVDARVVSP
jgi:hypothetical protein